jgi:hypothetical protein
MSDEENLLKLKNIEQLLRDDQSVKVGDLTLNLSGNDLVRVTGWSRFIYFKNITRNVAQIEMSEIKALFQLMRSASKELDEFVENKAITYFLQFDDAGKCGILVCAEEKGELQWYI